MKKILFMFLVITSQNLISQIKMIHVEMCEIKHEKIKKGKIIENIVKHGKSGQIDHLAPVQTDHLWPD